MKRSFARLHAAAVAVVVAASFALFPYGDAEGANRDRGGGGARASAGGGHAGGGGGERAGGGAQGRGGGGQQNVQVNNSKADVRTNNVRSTSVNNVNVDR